MRDRTRHFENDKSSVTEFTTVAGQRILHSTPALVQTPLATLDGGFKFFRRSSRRDIPP
jgi:hypothetical protein